MSKRRQKAKKVEKPALEILPALPSDEPADDRGLESEWISESNLSRFRRYRVEKWRQFHSPNPAMLRHILVSEGHTVFQWGDLPGSTYATHKHDEDQSHWVISGTLEMTVEAHGVYLMEAGDRDFMPAGIYHSVKVIGDQTAIYLVGELP